MADGGVIPGGTKNNYDHVKDDVDFPDNMDQIDKWILCDAVTSGGLLIAVDGSQADQLLSELRHAGLEAGRIGEVVHDHPNRIVVEL